MRRQVKGGKAGRGQRRKTLTRRNLPKAGGGRRSLAAGKETNIERLIRERDDALEQLASTSDVLKVISRSTFDLQAVLDALIATAAQLCRADMGILRRRVGDVFELAATCGVKTEWRKVIADHPNRPGRHSIIGRAAASGKTVQVADVLEDPEYVNTATQTLIGFRGILVTPMVRDGSLIGTLGFFKLKPGLFSPKQVELIENFAAQAVIAIENTRLLNELRQRADDLSEALEQQTATSEVLKIISGSPDELEPVFQAMLGNATRICQAQFGALFRYENDAFYPATSAGVPHALAEFWQQRASFLPPAGSPLDRLLKTRGVIFTNDAAAEPVPGAPARLGGARSLVAVPMFKDDALVGAIVIYRQEVQPFTDKQIALVSNFAAQAVIAIENARLLNDLNKLNQQLERRVTEQVSEIERMGRLRRFLPPQVADLIVASGTEKQLESHRREITALFCDLRGFTGFSESSDPEDVMALLREYHAAIGEIINKYGGTLERYAGDGVMVVFNDPIPVDNPALQAVLMAIDMRTAIGALIEKWRKLGHDIGFGIGIAHGFATLGTVGFEGRFDYAAIGTVSNVASRLCDEAKPGQILISPCVLMAVEKYITVEPIGDFALKGIRRPMTAYNVLATKAAD